jgi:hypothetical protein
MPDGRFIVLTLTLAFSSALAACEPNSPVPPQGVKPAATTTTELDGILATLNKNLAELNSCRLELSWTFTQPLLDTTTIRKGTLFYRKGTDRSRLRINFDSFQQDKEKPQSLREEIIFDGVWLTRIDHQLKEIKRDQLAPDEKPIGAFQLLTGRIPLIGFGSVDDLKKQFDIVLAEPNQTSTGQQLHLVLKTRPESDYKNDYKTVDVFTVRSAALPGRIRAVTPDDDVSEISLSPSGSQEVADSVFAFEQPRDFAIISKPMKNDEK